MRPIAAATEPSVQSDERWEFVRDRLAKSARHGRTAVVTVPTATGALETVLDTGCGEAMLWDPHAGDGFAACGAASVLRGHGGSRWQDVRVAAKALWDRVDTSALTDDAWVPRCFGGLSFRTGGADDGPWGDFGDALFVLPELTYRRPAKGDASLSIAAGVEALSNGATIDALIEKARALDARLRSAGAPLAPRTPGALVATDEMPPERWNAFVEAIRDQILSGRAEKIVAARRTTLTFERPLDAVDVLRELQSAADCCTRFAFRHGDVTFLGATPERLVRLEGLAVQTEALAGSTRPGDGTADALLRSPKEQSEHALVLDEIVRCLRPACAKLDYPDHPTLRELRHVLHLRTPIVAELRKPLHVLEIAERLHPTPAVAGVPTEIALEWIAKHEPIERGWYAAPVGWFDAAGDGELDVALRSGLLHQRQAHLFAGGGIVRDSDPASEYAETRLKLASLSSALHAPQ